MTDIVTLTPNPAVDISTSVEKIVPVNKLRCTTQLRDPGGGGVNVARVVKRLGGDVVAVSPDWRSNRRSAAPACSSAKMFRAGLPPSPEETREDFSVTEISSGQQYRFVLPGPRLDEAEWQECLDLVAKIEPFPRFLVASGSLPPGVPDDFYAKVSRIAKQRRRQDGPRHLRCASRGGCRRRSSISSNRICVSWVNSPACSCPIRSNGKKRPGAS